MNPLKELQQMSLHYTPDFEVKEVVAATPHHVVVHAETYADMELLHYQKFAHQLGMVNWHTNSLIAQFGLEGAIVEDIEFDETVSLHDRVMMFDAPSIRTTIELKPYMQTYLKHDPRWYKSFKPGHSIGKLFVADDRRTEAELYLPTENMAYVPNPRNCPTLKAVLDKTIPWDDFLSHYSIEVPLDDPRVKAEEGLLVLNKLVTNGTGVLDPDIAEILQAEVIFVDPRQVESRFGEPNYNHGGVFRGEYRKNVGEVFVPECISLLVQQPFFRQ